MLTFKYQQSHLLQDDFLGCTLDGKFYRLNNIQKLNYLLSYAYTNSHSVQIFEILDNPEDLKTVLYDLKQSNCFYSKLQVEEKILLVLFNSKDVDFAIGLVDSISTDYSLLCDFDLSQDDIDIESVCFHVYQLAQHLPYKNTRKEKLFTASDITPEMRLLPLSLVKTVKIGQ